MISQYDSFDTLNNDIINIVNKYHLSTEAGYLQLRKDYNENKSSLYLLVLTFYSFNNLIRFNNSNNFNTSYGKNYLNYSTTKKEELKMVFDAIKYQNILFSNQSFENFNYTFLNENDFVYCDPPYLITDAVYNEKRNEFTGWTQEKEIALYKLLDDLNEHNIKWGLSNVLIHRGQTNEILLEWSKKYLIFYPNIQYNHASYQQKSRLTDSIEVYITNYDSGYRDIIQENLF